MKNHYRREHYQKPDDELEAIANDSECEHEIRAVNEIIYARENPLGLTALKIGFANWGPLTYDGVKRNMNVKD